MSGVTQAGPVVAVLGTGIFVPGFAGKEAWFSGIKNEEHTEPSALFIKSMLRRRTSMLTKALAEAYMEALSDSMTDPHQVAAVFGSALGEVATMIGLLEQMWSGDGVLSPMRFVTSVHNTASGVVSIATGNQGFTTSLGADYDTPAMALTEGIALAFTERIPSVVCCGDEATSGDLVPGGMGWPLLSAAIVLAPVTFAPPGAPRISVPTLAPPTLPTPEMNFEGGPALARNPCVGLLDLVTALHKRHRGALALDRGKGRGYSIQILPGE